MGLTLERVGGDGLPRRRELTDDDLRLVYEALHDAWTHDPGFRSGEDRRRMLLHWFTPLAEDG